MPVIVSIVGARAFVATTRVAGETCRRCGKAIEEGQEVVSKARGRNGGRSYYHKECWKSLFIEA